MTTFTHINSQGEANMVDVSAKAETVREARAEAIVTMSKETLAMIVEGKHHKGDVLLRLVLRVFKQQNALGNLSRFAIRCYFLK